MDQQLIDKLWQHTDQTDVDNAIKYFRDPDRFRWQINTSGNDFLLPARLFIDETRELFMSFHHERSNSLRHCHDFFELIYVCQGRPVGIIDDQEIQLEAGHLCIMNPNAIHSFKACRGQTDLVLNIVLAKTVFQRSFFRILFNDPVLNSFFIRYQLENEGRPSFLLLQQPDPEIARLIELLLREYIEQNRHGQIVIESLLNLIFTFILRRLSVCQPGDTAKLRDILNHIYRNYSSVQLEEVASRFSYHPKYLSALIHRHTGQTFRNLITSIRLQNAVNYLIYTDLSIEQIAGVVGYKERGSFYSAFRRELGASPADYRHRHRQAGREPL